MPVATCHKCLNQGCVRYIFWLGEHMREKPTWKLPKIRDIPNYVALLLYHNWPTQGTRDNLSRMEKTHDKSSAFYTTSKDTFTMSEITKKVSFYNIAKERYMWNLGEFWRQNSNIAIQRHTMLKVHFLFKK